MENHSQPQDQIKQNQPIFAPSMMKGVLTPAQIKFDQNARQSLFTTSFGMAQKGAAIRQNHSVSMSSVLDPATKIRSKTYNVISGFTNGNKIAKMSALNNGQQGRINGNRAGDLMMSLGGTSGADNLSTKNMQNKYTRDIKMQASSIKESVTEQVPNVKVQVGPDTLQSNGKQKVPPAINTDITNQVFKGIEKSVGQARAQQQQADRNGIKKPVEGVVENKQADPEKKFQVQKKQLNVKKNHFDSIFSKIKNIPNPQFIKSYAELFIESRILEKIIPRDIKQPEDLEFFNPYLIRDTVTEKLVPEGVSPYVGSDLNGVNRGVTDLVYDLLDRGGKRWRPVLGMIFAECYGRDIQGSIKDQVKNKQPVDKNPNEDILWACALTEIMHNGSLMVDDLEDKSLMRRGDKCIHLKYGDDYACNTGTLMYLAPIVKLRDFIDDDKTQLDIMNICQEEMFNLHFGQNWDIHWHNSKNEMPTEQQYLQMVINKTSVLPRMCVRIISRIMGEELISKQQQADMVSYVEKIGAAFQIQDDLISILSEDYATSRGILAEDIHEGKKSLMVINTFYGDKLSQEKKDRLCEILNMQTEDEKLIREACGYLHESGSIDYAQNFARQMIAEAWTDLKDGLPEDTDTAKRAKNQLEVLSAYMVNREL